MQTIHPFIWFEDQAEDAANFYVELFPTSKIKNTVRYPEAAEATAGRPAGSVMTVDLEINGEHFTFLNGGKLEGFNLPNGSVSFLINCETQEEIDKYWGALGEGGKPSQCGWVQDKYGVTWQVVPTVLDKLLSDPDPAVVDRVTKCFMKMTKFVIADLEAAAKGD
jgi:predicted 3-demethylubiquinone-9 3-methyltransferase (glyoxalase superfamily)